MHYMLLLYGDDSLREMTPEQRQQMYGAYMAYRDALKASGALVHSGPLQPGGTAVTLRGDRGEVQVLDVPFAETKEQLAGYFLIDVADQDAALEWARRCPALQGGIVEVRPMLPITA